MYTRVDSIKIAILLLFLTFLSCARAPIKSVEQSLRPMAEKEDAQKWTDDLTVASLEKVLSIHTRYLQGLASDQVLYFGPKKILVRQYAEELEVLLKALRLQGFKGFQQKLSERFDTYEVYGQKKYGDVFITSYFNPVVQASPKKRGSFTQPLYQTPKDLVNIYWDDFLEKLPQLKNYDTQPEAKSLRKVIRGQLVQKKGQPPAIVPFYNRMEIDGEKKLESAKILAWVDPLDAFFLQIQGSALLEFPNGKRVYVGYSAQNGHPYVAIGKFLVDQIPLEEMSLQKIEEHLRALDPKKRDEILFQNPSYVFFQKLSQKPLTTLGTPVVSGRTIATDARYFPKGALAYLKFSKPVWGEDPQPQITWQPTSRFVVDQDTGGAIKGPGRVDLFWGEGPEAKKSAGVMKGRGELYYFVPKQAVALEEALPTNLSHNNH